MGDLAACASRTAPARPTVVRVRHTSMLPWLVVWRCERGVRRRARFTSHRAAIEYAQRLAQRQGGRRLELFTSPLLPALPPWTQRPTIRYTPGGKIW